MIPLYRTLLLARQLATITGAAAARSMARTQARSAVSPITGREIPGPPFLYSACSRCYSTRARRSGSRGEDRHKIGEEDDDEDSVDLDSIFSLLDVPAKQPHQPQKNTRASSSSSSSRDTWSANAAGHHNHHSRPRDDKPGMGLGDGEDIDDADVDVDALLGSILGGNKAGSGGGIRGNTNRAGEKPPGRRGDDDIFSDWPNEEDEWSSSNNSGNRKSGGKDTTKDNGGGRAGESNVMDEFERILSDMATKKEKVYKGGSQRPPPLFMQNMGIDRSGQKFLSELGPDTLFQRGPRASAYSANRLAGDMAMASPMAIRMSRLTASDGVLAPENTTADNNNNNNNNRNSSSDRTTAMPTRRGPTRPASMHARLSRRDSELEQALLGRLANCTSVVRLSSFVYDEIERNASASMRGIQIALASPAVFAELIRRSRELGAPLVGLYAYRHCHATMDIANKTRVLSPDVYEELLITTWGAMRDSLAAASVLRDAIAVGTVPNPSLLRCIDRLVLELHSSYNMDSVARQFEKLRKDLVSDYKAV
ncbi:hypothetical protein LPJ72_006139 [Coemansia sp. Benny D160-2]|nr:hypothetical protein LPJ72_006139 [Coemansia sp. Benny D160-2]